ncbi:HPF/RaiA family ribosome-associated protein [Algoriphagus namhaensis]
MNYTENYRGIKVDVQTHHTAIDDAVQLEIRKSIDKISKHTADINFVDVYFKVEGSGSSAVSIVGMRVAIPGPDTFAEDKGENWLPLLKSVTDKIVSQLKKS